MTEAGTPSEPRADAAQGADSGAPGRQRRRRSGVKRPYSRSGYHALKAAVRLRGLVAVDARTAPAQAMLAHRRDLIASLGGDDVVSPQQRALVEMAVRTRLTIDHGYAFILEQKTLVTRKRAFVPLVREVQGLVDSYTRILVQLGLERRARPIMPLTEYVEKTYGTRPENGTSSATADASATTATEGAPTT